MVRWRTSFHQCLFVFPGRRTALPQQLQAFARTQARVGYLDKSPGYCQLSVQPHVRHGVLGDPIRYLHLQEVAPPQHFNVQQLPGKAHPFPRNVITELQPLNALEHLCVQMYTLHPTGQRAQVGTQRSNSRLIVDMQQCPVGGMQLRVGGHMYHQTVEELFRIERPPGVIQDFQRRQKLRVCRYRINPVGLDWPIKRIFVIDKINLVMNFRTPLRDKPELTFGHPPGQAAARATTSGNAPCTVPYHATPAR